MSGLIRTRRNPLAYPAGVAPGFDPTHVAAAQCRASWIANNGVYIELRRGANATLGGTPGAKIYGGLGPTCGNATSTIASAMPSSNYASNTWAWIGRWLSTATDAGPALYCGGVGIYYEHASNTLKGWNGHVGFQFGPSFATGVDYFVCASMNPSGDIRTSWKNLSTGVTDTFTGSFPGYNVDSSSQVQLTAYPNMTAVAAAMVSTAFTPPTVQNTWAADPWSFWYPRRARRRVGITAGGSSFIPAWAIPSNPQVIGAY